MRHSKHIIESCSSDPDIFVCKFEFQYDSTTFTIAFISCVIYEEEEKTENYSFDEQVGRLVQASHSMF